MNNGKDSVQSTTTAGAASQRWKNIT